MPSAIGFFEWIVDDDDRRKKGLEEARRSLDLVQQVGGKRLAAPPVGATNEAGRKWLSEHNVPLAADGTCSATAVSADGTTVCTMALNRLRGLQTRESMLQGLRDAQRYAAGIGLTTTGVSNSLEEALREKSPTDLKILNRKNLMGMGASEKEAERFFANGAFSPTAQTAFILNLKSLDGVANRRAFIKLASDTSSTEPDAIFCVETAALMSKLHKDEIPLARITAVGDFPICIAKDGTVVVALQWDYAAWTPTAERFAHTLQIQGKTGSSYLVAISGVVSPRLRQELAAHHFRVEDRLSPGPLK